MLVIFSLGAAPPLTLMLVSLMSFPVVLSWVLLRVLEKDMKNQVTGYLWFACFLIWLTLQRGFQTAGFPFFDPPADWQSWYTIYAVFFGGLLFYLAARQQSGTREGAIRFTYFLVLLSALAAVYFIGLFFLSGVGPENLKPPYPVLGHAPLLTALIIQPNNLVDLFFPGFFVGFSLSLYIFERRWDYATPQAYYVRLLSLMGSTCFLAAGVIFTQSRAGILAFSMALFFYIILILAAHRGRGLIRLVLLLLVILGLFLVSLGIKGVFQEMKTLSETVAQELKTDFNAGRYYTMKASLELARLRGILGVGLSNFDTGWMYYLAERFKELPSRSYNDFLWIWAETGLPGLLSTAGVLVSFYFTGLRIAVKSPSKLVSYLYLALMAAMTGFCVHACVDPTFYVPALFWLIAIVLGLGSGMYDLNRRYAKTEIVVRRIRPYGKYFAAIILLVLSLVISGVAMRKTAAFLTTQGNAVSEEQLLRAAELDPLDSLYSLRLSLKVRQKGDSAGFGKALLYLDDAIEKNPAELRTYLQKAQLFYETGNWTGVEDSLRALENVYPGYYLAQLLISSFYLELMREVGPEDKAGDRYYALFLHHYRRAFEIYPQLDPRRVKGLLRPYLSAETFQKLLSLDKEGLL